jgi:hypothetical protein
MPTTEVNAEDGADGITRSPSIRRCALRLPRADDVSNVFGQRGVLLVPDFLGPAEADAFAACASTVAARRALHIRRSSDGSTLDYRVVTGDVIKEEAASLYDLYESASLLEWIRRVAGTKDVGVSPHVRSAVNINVLDTAGQQYRWHTDAVPYTVLVFLTTLPASAGGELLVRTRDNDVMTVRPVAGQLVLMDGQQCAHAVAPLRENAVRITVPMVFPAYRVERPPGLDDYLYAMEG